MGPSPARALACRGFTLIEVALMSVLLALLVAGVTSSFWTVQAAFDEELTDAELTFRSRAAMDRLVRLAGTAVTADAAYAQLSDGAGAPSTCLRFRELASVVGGNAIYDDALVVHLVGPNANVAPSTGIVVGRGPDLNTIWAVGAGPDGNLGTRDDDVSSAFTPGTPVIELLVPSELAPQVGPMLQFTDTASPSGRLVTITLRTNFLRPDGSWLRTTDFELVERVALRW